MDVQRRHQTMIRWLAPVAVVALGLTACNGADSGSGTDEGNHISWATSDVGSSGHSALVNLAAMLNREWGEFQIDVLPTAGAVQTVIGYSTGEYDGYYGADIAFYEMANEIDRFTGFAEQAQRTPVQSFWAFPLETGLAIHARDAGSVTSWADLAGQPVFTGPPPWDVRANLERAMNVVDVGHSYVEVDTSVAGSALDGGDVNAIIAYTAGEANPPPWLTEAELQTDLHILNPSDDEVGQLEAAGLEVVEVDASVFDSDVGVDTALLVPFFYGFHLGVDVAADDVYELLTVIEANLDELASADASFEMLAEDMADMQRRGVESSVDDVEVHPGLAAWMQEQDVWDDAWDDRIADSDRRRG